MTTIYIVGLAPSFVVAFFGLRAFWRTAGDSWDVGLDFFSVMMALCVAALWPAMIGAGLFALVAAFAFRLLRPAIAAIDARADAIVDRWRER